jgi:hypothetical protein
MFEPKGEFWMCSEANFRMVEKIFLRSEEQPFSRSYEKIHRRQFNYGSHPLNDF